MVTQSVQNSWVCQQQCIWIFASDFWFIFCNPRNELWSVESVVSKPCPFLSHSQYIMHISVFSRTPNSWNNMALIKFHSICESDGTHVYSMLFFSILFRLVSLSCILKLGVCVFKWTINGKLVNENGLRRCDEWDSYAKKKCLLDEETVTFGSLSNVMNNVMRFYLVRH